MPPSVRLLPVLVWAMTLTHAVGQSILYRIEDDDPSTHLGNSVAAIGDVNTDGIPDFAVSGYREDAGIVRVFNGVDGSELYTITITSAYPNSGFGQSRNVVGLGDLDGDSIEGIAGAAWGQIHGGGSVGRALAWLLVMGCFFARPAVMAEELDLQPKLLYEIDGDEGGDYFGFHVSPWADLNADGIIDFVASTWTSRDPAYFKILSGVDGAELDTVDGAGCDFGVNSGCGSLSDLNDDGIPEFYARSKDDIGKYMTIYSGIQPYRTHSIDTGNWGYNEVGDLDQDGIGDYALNYYFFGHNDSWETSIHSGKTGVAFLTIEDGHYVIGVDDLNEDSIPDLAVRRKNTSGVGPRFDITFISGAFRGSAKLSQIDEKFLLGSYDQESIMGHSRFSTYSGGDVWNAGDLNGDGLDDLILVIEKSTERYCLVAVSSDTSEGVLLETEGWTNLKSGPRTLADIGDLDEDGVTDFVTSMTTNGGGSGDWGLFVFSGKTGNLLFNMPGPDRSHDLFGLSVAAIDDLDGDGILEIAIGDPRIKIDGEDDPSFPGSVFVYSLGPASRNEAPDPQEQLQISLQPDGAGVIVAWPTTVVSPMLEMSTDLLEWEPVFEGPAPDSGQYIIPEQLPELKMYFRLRYGAP